MTDESGLDIVLVLPGAASLGAYQAGAAAAVAAGRNHLRRRGRDVEIPAVGGASAGAIVSLLTAHAVAQGLDPVKLLQQAWVDRVDLDLLVAGSRAPLGQEDLRDSLEQFLTKESFELRHDEPTDTAEVAVHIALTTLKGYRYQLHDLGSRPTDAVTYADWSHVRYPAGSDPIRLCRPRGSSTLDEVIASASNPAVFPPQLLDRTASADEYRRRGLDDTPHEDNAWWFADGGLVQSRPIHRTLALVPPSERDTRTVVIDPRSEGPSTGDAWADPGRDPDWLPALVRAMSIFPAQVLSDELRAIDEENRILESLAELAPLLEVSDWPGWRRWTGARDIDDGDSPIFAALVAAAGLSSDRRISADVIHPLLIADRQDAQELLAGDLLGDFAGFLSQHLRQSDFSLGYACARKWWEQALPEHGLGKEHAALDEHLGEIGPSPWERVERGNADISDLPIRSKLHLVWVAARAVWALLRP